MLLIIIFAFLVTKEVVLGLILVDPIVVSLVLVTTRDAILVDYSAHARVFLARLVLSVCHDYLYGFEVLGTRSNTLH